MARRLSCSFFLFVALATATAASALSIAASRQPTPTPTAVPTPTPEPQKEESLQQQQPLPPPPPPTKATTKSSPGSSCRSETKTASSLPLLPLFASAPAWQRRMRPKLKILAVPLVSGRSHLFVMHAVASELAARGHEVKVKKTLFFFLACFFPR